MNDIKNKLREMKITLVEFSSELEISRPTLDTYIELYESDSIIPKEKYQKIFGYLFNEEIKNREEFLQRMKQCHDLIEKDRLLGTAELNPKKTDILTSIIKEMTKDMSEPDCNEDIYIFINMIVRSYRREEIFQKLARYFLLLNAKCTDSASKEEEIYLSNYYKLFYEDKNNLLKMDNEYLAKFYSKAKDIAANEMKNKEKIKEALLGKVIQEIDKMSKIGIDVNNISIKELIKDINLDE